MNDYTVDGVVYSAIPIKDGGFTYSGDPKTDTMTITVPADSAIARLYEVIPPTQAVIVRCRKTHVGLSASVIMWEGAILQYTRTTDLAGEIQCEPLTAAFGRTGIHSTWDLQCKHPLYGPKCKVNKALFALGIVVSGSNGDAITADALGYYANGWWTEGYIEWETGPSTYERRAITGHYGTAINLLSHTYPLQIGMAATAYPGCARNPTICQSKFNNYPNYGGFPLMPGRSPFDGSPVF